MSIENLIKWTTKIDPRSGSKVLVGTFAIEHVAVIASPEMELSLEDAKRHARQQLTDSIVEAVERIAKPSGSQSNQNSKGVKVNPQAFDVFGVAVSDSAPDESGEGHVVDVVIGGEAADDSEGESDAN